MADSDTLRRPSRIPGAGPPATDSPRRATPDQVPRPSGLRGRPVIVACYPDDFSLSALEKLMRRLSGVASRQSRANSHASSEEGEP